MGVIHQHWQFNTVLRKICCDCFAVGLETRVHHKKNYIAILILGLQLDQHFQSGCVSRANGLWHNHYGLLVIVPSHMMLGAEVIDQGKIADSFTGK
jgi:hypothetical protein